MSNTKPTLMIIDGHSLAFRAYYGVPVERFQNSEGQHTNAIHGFIAMLLALLEQYEPDALAVAFDISRHSFRTEEYPEYKGNRGETPEEFKGQVPLLKEALAALGIITLEQEGFEADDILATLSVIGRDNGYRVLVVSGDRDTIQLINDDVTLLYPAAQGVKKLKEYDAQAVKEKYDVYPHQYQDLAALVGETSDNLPGVPLWGPKTAAKWINHYGSLTEILAHRDEIKGKAGENLRTFVENAERNRRLNELRRDLDLPVVISQLERQPVDISAVTEIFGKLEFRTLLTRVKKFAGLDSNGTAVADDAHSAAGQRSSKVAFSNDSAQAPTPQVFTPPIHLIDEELVTWLKKADRPALYFWDINRDGVIRVGVAAANGTVEFDWKPGTADYREFETWLKSEQEKIVFDAKALLHLLAKLTTPELGNFSDAQLLASIWRPDFTDRSFKGFAKKLLQFEVVEPDMSQLVPDLEAATGAAKRAWLTRQIHERALESLHDAGLKLYYSTELPLVKVLFNLEHRGVAIDTPLLAAQQAELRDAIAEYEQRAYQVIGREVNLGSPKQLQTVLFDELQMPKTRKIKSGFSTDAASLHELQAKSPHPFLDALLAHRETTKLSQIITSLEEAVAADGRIHSTLYQVGAATGRLASNSPNLQNIPTRSEAGNRIRGAFTHGSEYIGLLTADYSQIEMRVMAHLSEDQALIEAFNDGEDLHRSVGARVFGVTAAEVTPVMRAKVKAMSYGLAYGLGPFGLAKQLGISQAEAKQLMTDYFARFGKIRDYLMQVVETARADGYTETLFGRHRPFPELNSPNRVLRATAERAALNAPIQGTAADIIKIAMLKVESEIAAAGLKSRMLLQIHDELMFEVAPGEREVLEKLVRDKMASAAKLAVPLEVSVGFGPDWQQAEH